MVESLMVVPLYGSERGARSRSDVWGVSMSSPSFSLEPHPSFSVKLGVGVKLQGGCGDCVGEASSSTSSSSSNC